HAVDGESVGFVVVVQLANGRLRGVPVVQAMVLFVSLSESIRDGPGQDASPAIAVAKRTLFDLDLKRVGAVLALLNQVVRNVPIKYRERPQQVVGRNSGAGAQAGGVWQNSEERILQCSVVEIRISDRDVLVSQAWLVNVVTEGDMVFVIPCERNFRHDVVPQLMLDAKGIL